MSIVNGGKENIELSLARKLLYPISFYEEIGIRLIRKIKIIV